MLKSVSNWSIWVLQFCFAIAHDDVSQSEIWWLTRWRAIQFHSSLHWLTDYKPNYMITLSSLGDTLAKCKNSSSHAVQHSLLIPHKTIKTDVEFKTRSRRLSTLTRLHSNRHSPSEHENKEDKYFLLKITFIVDLEWMGTMKTFTQNSVKSKIITEKWESCDLWKSHKVSATFTKFARYCGIQRINNNKISWNISYVISFMILQANSYLFKFKMTWSSTFAATFLSFSILRFSRFHSWTWKKCDKSWKFSETKKCIFLNVYVPINRWQHHQTHVKRTSSAW